MQLSTLFKKSAVIISTMAVLSITLFCVTRCEEQPKTLTIGIIEPLEHKAMTEIVAGFSETLKKEYGKPVILDIENAQNDPNLKQAIIQKMIDQHRTVIAPIGVDATEMTLSMTKHLSTPIISLASDMTESDRQKLNPCHVAVVHDEIAPQQIIQFIHEAYPSIHNLTLIHSSANKVFPEVKDAVSAGKSLGITIKPMMVSSLPELYNTAQALPQNSQGIFVLKDSLIVSGISTLAKMASQKNIPLITSDQGSVQDGAGFALGVHEKQIGVEGAKLATAILEGKSTCDLPIAEMKNLTVFINANALKNSHQTQNNIVSAAKALHYNVEFTKNVE